MLPRRFQEIAKDDIEFLITNQVREGRTIEYKQELPGNSVNDKKEFLADVSSFANAAGGDIIFGIQEERDADGKSTGIPSRVLGLGIVNEDEQVLRLESIIRDGIDPRIPGVRIRSIEGFSEGSVLQIRIPKSWAAPHIILFRNWSRFYSRTSAGKYQLDVREIRATFALSEALPQHIREFRQDRLAKIIAGETPVTLPAKGKLVLHIFPYSAAERSSVIDLRILEEIRPTGIYWENATWRYNFDGYLAFVRQKVGQYDEYVQVFRSGSIEAVNANMLPSPNNDDLTIADLVLEPRLITSLEKYLQLLGNTLNLQPPAFVMLSLLGVKDCVIEHIHHPIDRDELIVPELLVDDFSKPAHTILQPAFDAIWQAAGWPRCMNYDEEGNRLSV